MARKRSVAELEYPRQEFPARAEEAFAQMFGADGQNGLVSFTERYERVRHRRSVAHDAGEFFPLLDESAKGRKVGTEGYSPRLLQKIEYAEGNESSVSGRERSVGTVGRAGDQRATSRAHHRVRLWRILRPTSRGPSGRQEPAKAGRMNGRAPRQNRCLGRSVADRIE